MAKAECELAGRPWSRVATMTLDVGDAAVGETFTLYDRVSHGDGLPEHN